MFLHRQLFSLRIEHPEPKEEKKFTVNVSKKSYKRAVDRNKLKRRGRAVISNIIKNYPPGFYILSAKKGALEIPFKDLESEINHLFKKIK